MTRPCGYGGCQTPAAWTLRAAYPIADASVHPRFAGYPATFAVACRHHLAAVMEQDMRGFGTTACYVVEPLP